MTVREALRHGAAVLAAAGVESPALDARLLLGFVAGVDQAALLRDRDAAVDAAAYAAVLARRVAREPVALILGRAGFWSMEFAVGPATLVPRADSETLIEAALVARPSGVGSVLDLGTGTGCLLLAALSEYPEAWGVGVDRVEAAAGLARRNARSLGFGARASFVCGDWGRAVGGRFNLVLSNPPYIRSDEIAGLMPEVAGFEPGSALDGGEDGLGAYRVLMDAMAALLAPGGLAVLELGAGQAASVGALARAAGFAWSCRRDLAGVERALLMERVEKGVGIAGRAH